jgi:hypothetical protein
MWKPKIYVTRGEHTIHHIPSINTLKNVVTQDIPHSRRGHNMNDCVLTSSEVDLGLLHSLDYLY